METLLRTALLDWLRADPALAPALNLISEEAPVRANPPWLGIAASASTDWSTKERQGREVRVALELHMRGDQAGPAGSLAHAVETRIASLPALQPEFQIASTTFLRARAEQRAGNIRAILIEFRFRLLSTEN